MKLNEDRQFAPPANATLLLKRVINKIGHPVGLNFFPRAFSFHREELDAARVFDTIYKEHYWTSDSSKSGCGSEPTFAKAYTAALIRTIRERHFRSMLDAPCGDLAWMGNVIDHTSISYRGGDISAEVVEAARVRYPNLNIEQLDICNDPLPEVDLWHCRDCLFHLPFDLALKALRNFTSSSIPWALITTHKARIHRNLDVGLGGFRLLDLERPPFDLPRPTLYLRDYRIIRDFPRYVALWRREAIADALRKARLRR